MKGLSLRSVASAAGISAAALSRIERRKQSVSVLQLLRIASVLGEKDVVRVLRRFV